MAPRAILEKINENDMVDVDLESTLLERRNLSSETSTEKIALKSSAPQSKRPRDHAAIPPPPPRRRVSMLSGNDQSSFSSTRPPAYAFSPLRDVNPFSENNPPSLNMSKAEKAKARVLEETSGKAGAATMGWTESGLYTDAAREFFYATGSQILGTLGGADLMVGGARKRVQARIRAEERRRELEEEPVIVERSGEFVEGDGTEEEELLLKDGDEVHEDKGD